MWTREELKTRAKNSLHNRFWSIMGISITSSFLSGQILNVVLQQSSPQTSFLTLFGNTAIDSGTWFSFWILSLVIIVLYTLFIGNVIVVGASRIFIDAAAKDHTTTGLFHYFSSSYLNVIKVMFLVHIKLIGWTLLFIVPGIVKSMEYQVIPYILAENPNMKSSEFFSLAKDLTYGHKWNMFVLDLSFMGWPWREL